MVKIVTEIKCSMCGTTVAAEDIKEHYRHCRGRDTRRQRLKDGQTFIISYGSLPVVGELRYDGYKIQCHICGKWYRGLATHIRVHGLTADEYREEFSLNRTQPLCSPDISDGLADKLRQTGLIGKNKFKCGQRPYSRTLRKQGRMAISRRRLGQSTSLTLKKYQAQLKNMEKLRVTVPCCICGKPTLGIKGLQRSEACPECRKERKKRYMKEWSATHKGYRKEYMKQWHVNHPGYNTVTEKNRRRHLLLSKQRSEAEQ